MSGGLLRPRVGSAIKTIIIICVVVYLLQVATTPRFGPVGPPSVQAAFDPVTRAFALWPIKVIHMPPYVWQVFTYMWLHDPHAIFHILFNMLVLWMIGGSVEARMGTRYFWRFYIICGLVAGLCALGVGALAGGLNPTYPMVILGASGSIFGVLAAFGLMFPDATILLFFFFPVRAWTAVLVLAGIEVLTLLQSGGPASIAHLTGMAAGYLLLKGEDPLRYLRIRWRTGKPRPSQRPSAAGRRPVVEDDSLMEELDRVLDKIHREGIASLSAREKEVLRRASERDQR